MIITKDNYNEILTKIRSYTNKYYMFSNYKHYSNRIIDYKSGFNKSHFIYAELHSYMTDADGHKFGDSIGLNDDPPLFYLDAGIFGNDCGTLLKGNSVHFFHGDLEYSR